MTIQAQNRLLKLLEDRNDKNVLLMTKDGGLVLDTIVSRAVNIRLVRLPKAQMEEYLKETGEKEDAVVLEAVMRGCPYRYPEVKKQIEIFRDIYARQLEIKSKADILYLFHEVKEKDKDSFYIKHRDKMFGLLNLEYSIYEELLLLEEGALKEPSDERYVNLRKFYEVEDIYRILTTIIQQKKRLENPGQYTRNDFVDLLRNLCR